jgi:hypothetical protein
MTDRVAREPPIPTPILPAYRQRHADGTVSYVVWCPHCLVFHHHGATVGHRAAHCALDCSPFHRTGYELLWNGEEFTDAMKRRHLTEHRRARQSLRMAGCRRGGP